ncbi:MAG: response regulator transcription factor [Firmicutes bacterium]|nr:response regulator transcription factor [Bacillota bacterium]
MKKYTIIVADDEKNIRSLVRDLLCENGFEVLEAEDGRVALEIYEDNPDTSLLILDIMMPNIDGWKVCKEIRKSSRVPIIMLTARTEEMDELESFEKGANDYIPKPFSLSVLLARVKAALNITTDAAKDENIISIGDLYINTEMHTVKLGGEEVGLTPIEYELILHLASNKDRVFSREKLLTQIWGYEYYGGDRTVDTHIGRLRLKMGAYGDKYIKTVRGYGYKFGL